MQAGFAKVDITPRVGVELCGFGPFLNRHSIAVRERLWARAMAVRQGESTLILVSCDLIGVTPQITRRVRQLIRAKLDIPKWPSCCTPRIRTAGRTPRRCSPAGAMPTSLIWSCCPRALPAPRCRRWRD